MRESVKLKPLIYRLETPDARSDAGVPEDRNAYANATLTPVAYGGFPAGERWTHRFLSPC